MSVTLFHIEPSLCSQKVRLALVEKGVEHHARRVDIGPRMESYEPWYVRLNPAAVVPTLVHDDTVVTDSVRILRYVDETFPGPPLRPDRPAALREQVDRWVARADGLDFRTLSYGRAPLPRSLLRAMVGLRLRRLRSLERRNPELAEAYRAKQADVERWREGLMDPGPVARAQQDLVSALDELDWTLVDGRRYLVGERYTLADLIWTVCVARARMLGLAQEIDERPALATWYAAMRSRPSFEEALVFERLPIPLLLRLFARPLAALALVGAAVLVAGSLLLP